MGDPFDHTRWHIACSNPLPMLDGARRRPARRALAGAIIILGALTTTRQSWAFCRSTTCDPRQDTSCDVDENGCVREGAPLSWRQLPLVYRFHAPGSNKLDNDGMRDAVRRAFETWSNASCNGERTSLRFEEGPDIPGTSPLGGTQPAPTPFGIYFRDDEWPYDQGDESLALTNQTFGLVDGYIDYSDIEVNTTTPTYALTDDEDGLDLQSVITHEVGHYIGLAHSRVDDSIMVASYCQSGARCGTSVDASRALADDDIEAVCALYPASGIAGVTYEPPAKGCATSPLSSSSSSRGPFGALALGALAVVSALARRAKRS